MAVKNLMIGTEHGTFYNVTLDEGVTEKDLFAVIVNLESGVPVPGQTVSFTAEEDERPMRVTLRKEALQFVEEYLEADAEEEMG